MSTSIDLSPPILDDEPREHPAVQEADAIQFEDQALLSAEAAAWSPEAFAEEQMRGLVRQLFLPGWLSASRQVLFLPVDPATEITNFCLRVGQTLTEVVSGTTCVVQATPHTSAPSNGIAVTSCQKRFGALRDSCQELSDKLWFMPSEMFPGRGDPAYPLAGLRARLAELRLEFDYTVLCGPAAASHGEAALLGGVCDGAVLVLQAHSTRRVTAQRVKQHLLAAKVHLLGVVLNGRTFPVPEAIYRRA